ncbi:hypothetical protein [Micromonospora palomenae]|uniref:hypothetical protein n=1 Tax=Micromonospora palomenae TaxID=1461247 RepID=UPI003F89864A
MPADHPGGQRRRIEVTGGDPAGDGAGPLGVRALPAAGGFVASTAGQSVTQPDAALDAIRWGFGLLPAAAMLAALLLQRRYTLDRAARAGD